MFLSLKKGCLLHATVLRTWRQLVDRVRSNGVVTMRVNVTTWIFPALRVCAPCLGKGSWATTLRVYYHR
jgi:hypothetical protein